MGTLICIAAAWMLEGKFLGKHAVTVTLRLEERMPAPRAHKNPMLPLYVSKLTLFKYSSFALVFTCSDWQKIHHHTTHIHIQNVPAIALFFQDQWMQWGTARTSVTFRSQGSRKSEMGISRNGSTPFSLDGLFSGKSHLEMDDDWGYPHLWKPLHGCVWKRPMPAMAFRKL